MSFCAIYCRVSSALQDVALSLSAQESELRVKAQDDGFEVFQVYSDAAESGRLFDRPAFSRMIADAKLKPPPFSRIYLWDISRFGRDRIQSATIKQMIRALDIEIIYLKENIEDTLTGRLVESVIEAIAEYNSLKTAEDTRRGHRDLTAWGYHHGGKPPYGYRVRRVVDGGKERSGLEPNPEEAARIRWMFSRALEGATSGQIARELNERKVLAPRGGLWHRETVRGILINPVYVGRLEYGRTSKVLVAGKKQKKHHPPETWKANDDEKSLRWRTEGIVEEQIFAKVSAMVQCRPRGGCQRTERRFYLLAGVATCAKCGGALVGTTRGRKSDSNYHYYRCGRAKSTGVCVSEWIPAAALEEAVISCLRRKFSGVSLQAVIRDYAQRMKPEHARRRAEVDKLKAELRKIEAQVTRLVDAISQGFPSESIRARLNLLEGQKRAILEAVRALDRDALIDAAILEDGLSVAVVDLADALKHAQAAPVVLNSLLRDFCKVAVDLASRRVRVDAFFPEKPGKPVFIDFPGPHAIIKPGRSGRTALDKRRFRLFSASLAVVGRL